MRSKTRIYADLMRIDADKKGGGDVENSKVKARPQDELRAWPFLLIIPFACVKFSLMEPKDLIKKLQAIVGVKDVIDEKEKLENYSHDEFSLPTIRSLPQVAVRPHSAEEISRILKLANKERIPVTPRGGGTGLCGGCVPVKGGIVVLFDNLNKILEIDLGNLMATAGAGVLLRDLCAAVEKDGLFFPPHPGDETATIGGVVATNAGGSRALKYGTVRNFVRGIEAVLPQGDVINIGGKFIKNSSGFNLLNLFIGSEGTLGVITKVIVSFLPAPKETASLIIPYDTISEAIETVPEIIKAKILPLAIEFIEADAIEFTEKYLNKTWPLKGSRAYLFIIIDGTSDEEIERLSEEISSVCLNNNAKDVFIADSKAKQKEILDFRSQMYEALKPSLVETLDIVVPRSEVANHIAMVHQIEREYGIWLPTYGHAGDGNAHTHIMKFSFSNGQPDFSVTADWQKVYPVVRRLLHEDAKKRGGMVSGEHGIGLVKKEYLPDFIDRAQLELMKAIKRAFDPNNILNPGKII